MLSDKKNVGFKNHKYKLIVDNPYEYHHIDRRKTASNTDCFHLKMMLFYLLIILFFTFEYDCY